MKTSAAPERVIAGVLFALAAVLMLSLVISSGASAASVETVFLLLGFAFTAAALFARSRDAFLVVALGVICLALVTLLIHGFFTNLYSNVQRIKTGRYSYETEYHFSLFHLLPVLALLLPWVLLTRQAAVVFLGSGDSSVIRRSWYLPALLILAAPILALLGLLFSDGNWTGFQTVISLSILNGILMPAFLLTSLWILGQDPEGYYPIPRHLAMTLFTLGLWFPVWIWHNTRYLNRVKNEETRRPTATLLLCLFLPLYLAFWCYASAQRVDRLAREKGVESHLSLLCLVLGILFPFLVSIPLQDKINRIHLVENGVFVPDPACGPAEADTPSLPVLDETLPEL